MRWQLQNGMQLSHGPREAVTGADLMIQVQGWMHEARL